MGVLFSALFNKALEKPVHELSFSMAGTVYDKKRHPAWLGSIIYSIMFIIVMGLVGVFVSIFTK